MQFDNYIEASNPNNNVWVSASAGSGKTKLLVDRFLRLIMSGVNLGEILCITFTKAAANEMSERVKTILEKWFNLQEEDLTNELIELKIPPSTQNILKARTAIFDFLENIEKIKIVTIHSICQEILARFPLESGSKISSKIIDENEKEALIRSAKHLLLESDFIQTENLRTLFESISEFNISKIIDNILSFECLSFEWSNISENKDDINSRIDQVFENISNDRISQEEEKIIKQLRNIQRDFSHLAEEVAHTKTIDDALREKNNPKEVLKITTTIFFTKDNKPKAKLLNKELINKYPDLNKRLLETQHSFEIFYELYNNAKLNRISKGLSEIKFIFDEIYKKIKYQKSYYDFNDIINETFKLLSNQEHKQWVKFKFGNRFKHILVDESQDTNISQWKIIDAIFVDLLAEDDSSLFIVGDEKQSIYSFQGASPQIFSGIKNLYKNQFLYFNRDITEIGLQKSFRSSQLVLDFVDKVFENICAENPTAISSPPKHNAFFNFSCSYIEILPLIHNSSDKKEKPTKWQIPIQKEEANLSSNQNAELIINKIKHLLSNGYTESDILILIRKRDDFSSYLSKRLKDENIEVNSSDKIILNQHIISKDIISFAEFLLYPYDDLNLASLLKSYFFEFTEQEILDLCLERKGSLWETLKACSKEKSIQTSSILQSYINSPITNNIYDLFFDVLIGQQYKRNFYKRAGKESEEIIDAFLDICQKYQDANNRSLTEFTDWIKNSNIEVKFSSSTNSDEIRMMTIHGAKGLQSEIVILAESSSTPKMSDNLFWDNVNNIPVSNGEGKYISQKYTQIKAALKNKLHDEYFRLLYVAMTRAKTQLYIFGHYNSLKPSDSSWYSHMQNSAKDYFEQRLLTEEEKSFIQNSEIANEGKVLFIGKFISKAPTDKVLHNVIQSIDLPKTVIPTTTKNIELSEPTENSNQVRNLGILVHKFFEMTINKKNKNEQELLDILFHLMRYYGIEISASTTKKIISCQQEISRYIAHSLSIKKEQEILSRQDAQYKKIIIDLLIERDEEVIIADYKMSNFNQVNRALYIEQLSEYKNILKKIYPNKIIKCCIIWVPDAKFDFI